MRKFRGYTRGLLTCLLLAVSVCANRLMADEPAPPNAVEALIDKLVEMAEADIGYMPTRSGSGFAPLGVSETSTLILGQGAPSTSVVIAELVSIGAQAVPHLIEHLGDDRQTKIKIQHAGGFGSMSTPDEYDCNWHHVAVTPEGVNRHSFNENEIIRSHTVTVGDLCFVALGQIVNRHFNAVRYQPTACIMVNSPTRSEALRRVITEEWSELTPERHKESLVRDFREPDHENRRTGACLRLAYYYPEVLEPLVLEQLALPRYNVFKIQTLIRDGLYGTKTAEERRDLFDDFVAKHNDVTREGIRHFLFEDLDSQEADEVGRISPRLHGAYIARTCLIELFGYPTTVKSSDRPKVRPLENCAQARFIDTLVHCPSKKIDGAVREVMHSTDEDYLIKSCINYLVGRGCDEEIRRYVDAHMLDADEVKQAGLGEFIQRLGWTPLHAASDEGDLHRIERLIREGADINARAENGWTPLHVAAEQGEYGSIGGLLALGADPNIRNNDGLTPASVGNHFDACMRLLLEAGAEPSDIIVASFANRPDLIEEYARNDSKSVHAVTSAGATALHIAARLGHAEVAKVLLAHGADVNAREGSSKLTPLLRAAIYKQTEVVAILLANEADFLAQSWDGRTAIEFSYDNHDERTIGLLKEAERQHESSEAIR